MTDRRQTKSASDSTSQSSLSGSRRDFLKGSTAAAAASALATGLTVPLVHAAGSGTIKVGLIGCGGRGTGAAEQALTADSGAKSRRHGRRVSRTGSTIASPSSRDRRSPPASTCRRIASTPASTPTRHVIDQVDLVLLTTPPHFRPLHLAYAVEKGVNAFVEKPMAVDGPGLRKFLEACKDAKAKNLSHRQRLLLAL